MPLNPQTANFPPLSQVEHSWEQNVRKSMELMAPGVGIRSGLELGLPMTSGQPVAGLTPTLTDGYLVKGDQVMGPYGSKLISAAPLNVATRKLFFGLSGMYWGDSTNLPLKPTDVRIGEITTDAVDSIISVAQAYNYGACLFGARGVVNLSKAVDGSDQNLFTWSKPADLGLKGLRVSHAQARVIAPVTAGNTSGDDFLLKVNSTTLVTLGVASLPTLNALAIGTPDATFVIAPSVTDLVFKYNQTDTSTAIAGGAVEFNVILQAY